MEYLPNYLEQEAMDRYLSEDNQKLMLRMVRRRVFKLSEGTYRLDCIKYLESKMEAFIKINLRYTSGAGNSNHQEFVDAAIKELNQLLGETSFYQKDTDKKSEVIQLPQEFKSLSDEKEMQR